MQMPRNVWLLHCQDLLDAPSTLPSGRRQPQGSLRRRLARHGLTHRQQPKREPRSSIREEKDAQTQQQHRGKQHPLQTRESAEEAQVQLPTEAVQSGAQVSRCQGPRLLRAFASVLREEPQAGDPGHPRQTVQRHVVGGGGVRFDVLRERVQEPGGGGG